MERVIVKSSNIQSVSYSTTDKILKIEFKSGDTYRYKDVEPKVHMNLMNSGSIGKAFFTMIKGKFEFEKV